MLWKNLITSSKTVISGPSMFAAISMGQELATGARVLKSRWCSTGSKPPWLKGLQRTSRQAARTSPRSMPNRVIACTAYSEHDG